MRRYALVGGNSRDYMDELARMEAAYDQAERQGTKALNGA